MGLKLSLIVTIGFTLNAYARHNLGNEPSKSFKETVEYCQDRSNFGYGWLKNLLVPDSAIKWLPNPLGEACEYGAELAFSSSTNEWQTQDFVDQCRAEFRNQQLVEACLLPIVLSRLSKELNYGF